MDTSDSSTYTFLLIESDKWEMLNAHEQEEEDKPKEGCSPRVAEPASSGSESPNCLKAVLLDQADRICPGLDTNSSKILVEGQVEQESSLRILSDQVQTELTESDSSNCAVNTSISDSPSQSMLMCSEVIVGSDNDHHEQNSLGIGHKRSETESREFVDKFPVLNPEDIENSPADILQQDGSMYEIFPQHSNDPRPETEVNSAIKFKCSLCTKVFRSESSFLRHKNVHRLNSRRPVTQLPQSVIQYIDRPGRKNLQRRKNEEEEFGWTFSLQKHGDRPAAQNKKNNQGEHKSSKGETLEISTKYHSTIEDMTASERITTSLIAKDVLVDGLSGDVSTPEDIHELNRTVLCGLCNEGFSKFAELETHMIEHSSFSCNECGGLTFPSSAKLKRHCHIHARKQSIDTSASVQLVKHGFGKRNFPCNLCDKVFTRPAQLKFHLIAHSDISCVLCNGVTFASSEELKIHLKTHFGSKKPRKKYHRRRVFCKICNKDFARPHQLRKHMSISVCAPSKSVRIIRPKDKILNNSVTEKSAKSSQNMDSNRFSCSMCNKSFSRCKGLEKHMAVHGFIACERTKAMWRKDDSVNKQKSVQRDHSKTHSSTVKMSTEGGQTKRKRSKSTFGPGQWRQPKGRTKTSAASKIMPTQRQISKKSHKPSGKKQTLKTSQQRDTIALIDSVERTTKDKAFPCYLCGVEFLQPAELELHIHLHTAYSCEQCDGLTFPSSEELKTHMLNGVHAMQLKCPVCNATYASQTSLSHHIATHSDVVPRICEFCFCTFHSLKSLKIHQIMDHANSKLNKNL